MTDQPEQLDLFDRGPAAPRKKRAKRVTKKWGLPSLPYRMSEALTLFETTKEPIKAVVITESGEVVEERVNIVSIKHEHAGYIVEMENQEGKRDTVELNPKAMVYVYVGNDK